MDEEREARLAALEAAGVRVEDPATTHVGPDVKIERGAVLKPFTVLEGRTIVRADAVIGPFVRLVDMEIGPGALVLDHCLLRESVVEAGASVGPFAHLRPGSRVGASAKVGNFVELKKTRLGPRSKANHLTYLGDAEIGADVNVGAGTITCNYDGVNKFTTVLEDGVFVGSDTQFIAPVTVGKGAYIGAGSTITKNVPAGSLAVSRVPQRVVPDGAVNKRERAEAARRAQEDD
jgi:bifunctional UDP-N-acetylglucosamine pyrophosphorylase/glucosamine-1-phosphate N-acetyltransferase